jgi:hypothetical protein
MSWLKVFGGVVAGAAVIGTAVALADEIEKLPEPPRPNPFLPPPRAVVVRTVVLGTPSTFEARNARRRVEYAEEDVRSAERARDRAERLYYGARSSAFQDVYLTSLEDAQQRLVTARRSASRARSDLRQALLGI